MVCREVYSRVVYREVYQGGCSRRVYRVVYRALAACLPACLHACPLFQVLSGCLPACLPACPYQSSRKRLFLDISGYFWIFLDMEVLASTVAGSCPAPFICLKNHRKHMYPS